MPSKPEFQSLERVTLPLSLGWNLKPESCGLADNTSFKFLTYQLPTVGCWPTVPMAGNGEIGFDSGERASETATTSKERKLPDPDTGR